MSITSTSSARRRWRGRLAVVVVAACVGLAAAGCTGSDTGSNGGAAAKS